MISLSLQQPQIKRSHRSPSEGEKKLDLKMFFCAGTKNVLCFLSFFVDVTIDQNEERGFPPEPQQNKVFFEKTCGLAKLSVLCPHFLDSQRKREETGAIFISAKLCKGGIVSSVTYCLRGSTCQPRRVLKADGGVLQAQIYLCVGAIRFGAVVEDKTQSKHAVLQFCGCQTERRGKPGHAADGSTRSDGRNGNKQK